jgi:BolA protein
MCAHFIRWQLKPDEGIPIMNSRYDRIRAILVEKFSPDQLEIEDESGKHAGHAHRTGAPSGGETHYRLLMVSNFFSGQPRVARSRAVHAALEAEFQTGLHAISLALKAPDEANQPKF